MDAQEKRRRMKARAQTATARKRYKYECAVCGFDVVVATHHIRPVSRGGGSHFSNLINLCPNCHTTVHRIRREGHWLCIDNLSRFYSEKQIAFLISVANELLDCSMGGKRGFRWHENIMTLEKVKNYFKNKEIDNE